MVYFGSSLLLISVHGLSSGQDEGKEKKRRQACHGAVLGFHDSGKRYFPELESYILSFRYLNLQGVNGLHIDNSPL